ASRSIPIGTCVDVTPTDVGGGLQRAAASAGLKAGGYVRQTMCTPRLVLWSAAEAMDGRQPQMEPPVFRPGDRDRPAFPLVQRPGAPCAGRRGQRWSAVIAYAVVNRAAEQRRA